MNIRSCESKAVALFHCALLFAVLIALPATNLCAQSPTITQDNWGAVTAPVYGNSEKGAYAGADLFAGPNKFGSYFSGVLPNGRMVKPAGTTVQIGMNPLGIALTPDGKYLITSNDDEREKDQPPSYRDTQNRGGYSLSVVDAGTMKVVSQYSVSGKFFIGLQVTGAGPYTVWASGGPDNDVKLFTVSSAGEIIRAEPASITIRPFLPSNKGYVSIFQPGPQFSKEGKDGSLPPTPTGFKRSGMTQTTFPAGSALSPDGHYLYVACNGDNSVAVIDTRTFAIVRQIPVGYFPYSVSVSANGENVAVSNWGITEYKFKYPTYDNDGNLAAIRPTGRNTPDGFYVPVTNVVGPNPKTSSVSLLRAGNSDGTKLTLSGSVYQGHRLDSLRQVGDTHPSAMAIVHHGSTEVLYVTKSNSDSLGVILLPNRQKLPDVDLSPVSVRLRDGHKVHGAYPNALAVSPDNNRLYVAEAGINSVAVLDVSDALHPVLLGRIPTGWYPTALAVSSDGHSLYIANAKGIGEDINSKIDVNSGNPPPSGIGSGSESDHKEESNYVFGTAQKVDLQATQLENKEVLANNFSVQSELDASIVPLGGARSKKIKHVFFILHENKTFDSMLGNMAERFGSFASLTYNKHDGSSYSSEQFTGVSVNLQAIAGQFAAGVNYYSDAEESDAGHQFAASGTATDYTEKTLLVKNGRGLLVNKNFEPEDYPEGGYIFNNAARHGLSFKDYGALVRLAGSDTGASVPTRLNDPGSGKVGYPRLVDESHVAKPLSYDGDITSPTIGLGQSYFLALPALAVLGTNNPNGEPRLDHNYPGYNFNISDRRRALKFIADFDRMAKTGKLPDLLYIYQPNDHTGTEKKDVGAPNADKVGISAFKQVADGDAALGMVVQHIMKSRAYYDPKTGEGSAIFITWDDAQSTLDHIHPHRTPLLVISPYAKNGPVKKHYSTASIVKTEELLLGLPPNNLGDLFATDLRDMFQDNYNGVKADAIKFNLAVNYTPSPEGERIWALVEHLDTSAPDRDSHRLGVLARLSAQADELHNQAARQNCLDCAEYRKKQEELMESAIRLAQSPAHGDSDD